DAVCSNPGGGYWSNLRGAKWINGHYADANYNHHLLPNDPRWDCSNTSHNPGQAAARSLHTGGVNVVMGDGSLHVRADGAGRSTWEARSPRAGGGVRGDYGGGMSRRTSPAAPWVSEEPTRLAPAAMSLSRA